MAEHERTDKLIDAGLLALRLVAGAMMLFGHGLVKVLNYGKISEVFSDPLGVGSATSLALAAGAEIFGALAVMAGFKTRWASLLLVFTMLVAASTNWSEGFSSMERALVYAVIFGALAITGAGKYSVDARLDNKKER